MYVIYRCVDQCGRALLSPAEWRAAGPWPTSLLIGPKSLFSVPQFPTAVSCRRAAPFLCSCPHKVRPLSLLYLPVYRRNPQPSHTSTHYTLLQVSLSSSRSHLIQVCCVPLILILRVYNIPINCEHGSWRLLRLLNIAHLCSFVVNRGLKHRCSLKLFITVSFLDWVSCTRH